MITSKNPTNFSGGSINNLLFNFFLDMRKKDIDKRQRATLIAKYLKDNNMSGRQLAKELGIPHSTIHDWLLINRITPEVYDKYIEEGSNDTTIYRMLRNNKQAVPKDYDQCLIREELKKATVSFNKLINYGKKLDADTINDISKLVNVLNRILLHKERNF